MILKILKIFFVFTEGLGNAGFCQLKYFPRYAIFTGTALRIVDLKAVRIQTVRY